MGFTNLIKRWRPKPSRPSSSTPSDVPPGHVAIIVGCERRRIVVRATQLIHPAFRKLLSDAEEEYEFSYSDGPISIPCDEPAFFEALRLSAAPSFHVGPVRFTRLGKCQTGGEPSQPLLFGLGVS